MSARLKPIAANDALIDALERDGELDRILSGRGLTFHRTIGQAAPPPQPFYIPPPDWDEEERERKEQEKQRQQQERDQIIQEELARITPDQEPPETRPAKKRSWRS